MCSPINCQPCTTHLRKFVMVLTWLTGSIRIVLSSHAIRDTRRVRTVRSQCNRPPDNDKCQSNLYLFDIQNYFVNFHYSHYSIIVTQASSLSLVVGGGGEEARGGEECFTAASVFMFKLWTRPMPTLFKCVTILFIELLYISCICSGCAVTGISIMYLGGCCGRCILD